MTRCDHCGLSYEAFRSPTPRDAGQLPAVSPKRLQTRGLAYRIAYHQIAWTREHVSDAAVKRSMAEIKRADWELHLAECGAVGAPWSTVDPSDFADRVSFDVRAFDVGPGDCEGCAGWGVIESRTAIECCAECGGHGRLIRSRETMFCDARMTMCAA